MSLLTPNQKRASEYADYWAKAIEDTQKRLNEVLFHAEMLRGTLVLLRQSYADAVKEKSEAFQDPSK